MDCIGFYAVLATSPPYYAGGPKSPKMFSKLPLLTEPIVDNISIRWKIAKIAAEYHNEIVMRCIIRIYNSKHCEKPDIILNYHECPGWQGICLNSPSSNKCITTKRFLLSVEHVYYFIRLISFLYLCSI